MCFRNISTQNICTLVVKCLQTNSNLSASEQGLTLEQIFSAIYKVLEESSLRVHSDLNNANEQAAKNGNVKLSNIANEEIDQKEEERSINPTQPGTGNVEGESCEPGTAKQPNPTVVPKKPKPKDDKTVLREKILIVLDLLCCTPLVEVQSFVGDAIRGDKKYRFCCSVELPLSTSIDLKTIERDVIAHEAKLVEQEQRIKRLKAELSKAESLDSYENLGKSLKRIVGTSEMLLTTDPLYSKMNSLCNKKAKVSKKN